MRDGKIVYTPEGVGINYDTAGIGSRFMALLLDTLLQSIVIFFIVMTFIIMTDGFKIQSDIVSWYIAIMGLAVFIFTGGYFILFESLMAGRTPGKVIAKLRVVKTNGAPVDFASSLVRNIFRIVDTLPILYCVGVLVMFSNRESRRVGDYIAGTIVIKEDKTKLVMPLDKYNKNIEDIGMFPLSLDEFQSIKDFLTRRETFVKEYRYKLAKALATKVWDKFLIHEDDRVEPERFLERVYISNI